MSYGYISITVAGVILWIPPANERWHYIAMSSLIGWAHTQNDPWKWRLKWPAICHFCNSLSRLTTKKTELWIILLALCDGNILMGQCKKDLTPLLMQYGDDSTVTHSFPVSASYGVFHVSSKSDLRSPLVPTVLYTIHYSNVTWVSWCLKLLATSLLVQTAFWSWHKRKHQSLISLTPSVREYTQVMTAGLTLLQHYFVTMFSLAGCKPRISPLTGFHLQKH